jgi:hypothetical protein
MTSLPGVPHGSQEPRLRSCPPYRTTAAAEALELAASAGVFLDPWQELALRDALAEDSAGRWVNFEVGLVVARQNGKGEVLLARELAGLFLFGERLIIHTAHEFKTSNEAFLRIKLVIENCDDLRRKVKKIYDTPAFQGVVLKPEFGGGRLRFLARSKGSGRGFTGDLVILDEAYELQAAAVGALLPTMSARPNPQLWYASSAGMADSEQLNDVRRRAVAGGDPSLCYLEWSAVKGKCALGDACTHKLPVEGCWLDDRVEWARANPAFGYRISESFTEKERRSMPPEEFERERLTIFVDQRSDAVLDMDKFDALADPASAPVGALMGSFDIPPSRDSISIAIAGKRADGRAHLELIEIGSPVGAADRLLEYQTKHSISAFVVDPGSPAGSLIPDLDRVGVRYQLVTAQKYAQACGAMYDANEAGTFAHLGQAPLTTALLAAKKRNLGDGWAWDRKDDTDISPLVAVTLAQYGLSNVRDIALAVW